RQSRRKALTSSAVVCSVISHHALNVLWRELNSVHPLLRVLPNYKRVATRLTLCGAILPEHWTRFRLYADRVRVLHGLQRQTEEYIQPSVWLFLAAKCKGSPLMPRLRVLCAHNIPISEISVFTLLISPTLRTINFSFTLEQEDDADMAPHAVDSLLHTIPLMAPDLEDFSYDVDFTLARGPVNLVDGHLESFRLHFTRLTTLSICCEVVIDSDRILRSLSSIPTLQSLTLTTIILPSVSALALPENRFEQLTDLHLGGHFDHLTAVVQACQLPRLASMSLETFHSSTGRETRGLVATIRQRCDPALLTSFSLKVFHKFAGAPPPPRSLVQYFEPLLAFPNVASFYFHCHYIVPPVHDDDLVRFGTAWPHLTSFYVSNSAGQYSQPNVARATLSGLVEFAQHCPRLHALHLPELDASVLPAKGAVPLLRHKLRHLGIRNVMATLEPKVYMEMAAVLDRVFPAVDLEHARSESMVQRTRRGWRDILQFMEAMRLGRETAGLYAGLPEEGEI
ncbi:hypothetical protein V8D89_001065, partial [Ganoderma adspersum]